MRKTELFVCGGISLFIGSAICRALGGSELLSNILAVTGIAIYGVSMTISLVVSWRRFKKSAKEIEDLLANLRKQDQEMYALIKKFREQQESGGQ